MNAKGAFWYKVYKRHAQCGAVPRDAQRPHEGTQAAGPVVVDGLPAHKAKSVAKYVQSTKGRLELHFLPPYAPDLNPDEFAWSHFEEKRDQ